MWTALKLFLGAFFGAIAQYFIRKDEAARIEKGARNEVRAEAAEAVNEQVTKADAVRDSITAHDADPGKLREAIQTDPDCRDCDDSGV
jgi:hypothetical protein